MSTYLCYDLRAIQSFIFRIPRLKYIIGGSALIDQFDREVAPKLPNQCKQEVKVVSCGGGKGAFFCSSHQAAIELESKLVQAAHDLGVDIRIGNHEDYSEAVNTASRLYPFVPPVNDGHPCNVSGLYPVNLNDCGPDKTHPIIKKRLIVEGDTNYRYFEKRLLDTNPDFGPGMLGSEPVFLHSATDAQGEAEGNAGLAALDGRARWAVICMDGNDMGKQFTAMRNSQILNPSSKTDPTQLLNWVQEMSKALDNCANEAAKSGIEAVVRAWLGTNDRNQNREDATYTARGTKYMVVPIRPVVVGGDDIAVLCHPRYAFTFVKKAVQTWQSESERAGKAYSNSHNGQLLWPATKNELSISAGVFFCPVTMPLHTAIPYAESLLGSAKTKGRDIQNKNKISNQPTPPCVDWEFATESILDTPAARRKRELTFFDEDINLNIELTQRPFTLDNFEKLERRSSELKMIPRSIRHQLVQGLRAGANDRELLKLRLAKRYLEIGSVLSEDNKDWWENETKPDSKRRSTSLLDALHLLEESDRQEERRS